MKKVLVLLCMLMCVALSFAEGSFDSTARETQQVAQQTSDRAMAQTPIPQIAYFVERTTIAKWYERWDKPSVVTYVYLVSYGNILGYYVCNGKPASTKSYIIPEEKVYRSDTSAIGGSYGWVGQAPDLDGTYGDNNAGIRFFTAEGTAVEWAGSGASYIYSDAPLPINVPKLNIK